MNEIVEASITNGEIKRPKDSPVTLALSGDQRWARTWLILRACVGWEWVIPGWWGLDRWLTPVPGAPGRADHAFRTDKERAEG